MRDNWVVPVLSAIRVLDLEVSAAFFAIMVAKDTGSLFLLTILKLTRCWAVEISAAKIQMKMRHNFQYNIC